MRQSWPINWIFAVIEVYRIVLDSERFRRAGRRILQDGNASAFQVKAFYNPVHSYRAVAVPLQIAGFALLPHFLLAGNGSAALLYAASVLALHTVGMRWAVHILRAVESGRLWVLNSRWLLFVPAFSFSVFFDAIYVAFLISADPGLALMFLASWAVTIVVLAAAYYFDTFFAVTATIFNLAVLMIAANLMVKNQTTLDEALGSPKLLFPIGMIFLSAVAIRAIMRTNYETGVEFQKDLNIAQNKVNETLDDMSQLNRQIAAIANSSEHAIALIDAHGEIELMNRRFAMIVGLGSRKNGLVASEVLPPAIVANTAAQFVYDHGEEGESYLVSRVGENGRMATVLMLTDITERLRQDRERIQLERMGVLGTLSSGIAHDFNNLLSIIQNQIDVLTVEEPGLRDRVEVHDIRQAIAGGSALARQLLSYTHQLPLSRQRVVLGQLVRRVLTLAKSSLGADIVTEISITTEASVVIDSYILEVNLLNLFINARDAMGGKGRIRVSLDRDGDFLELRVQDEGKGIPPATLVQVFEPFFTTKDRATNAGLGLALAKSFIEKSGGTINIESTVGVGTTIILRLPVENSPERGIEPALNGPEMDETIPASSSATRVLIIDDVEALMRSQVQVLRHWFNEVEGYMSIQALVASRDLAQFDVVLCDLLLKNENGLDVLQLFRQKGLDTPVIFFSGNVPPEIRQQIDAIEPSVFIEKPASLGRIVATIEQVMHARQGG